MKITKNKKGEIIQRIGHYLSGKKMWEQNFKDGQLHGKQYDWYESGKIMHEYNYKNGKKEGKQYEMWEFNYKNGEFIN